MDETVWDGQNRAIFDTQDVTPDLNNYQSWQNFVRGKHNCTGDMCVVQDRNLKEKSQSINRKDIATTLRKRNLLRLTDSIQISLNGTFCSSRFTMRSVMETFCTKGLIQTTNLYRGEKLHLFRLSMCLWKQKNDIWPSMSIKTATYTGFITPHKILKVYDTKLVQGYTTYRTYENILTNEYIYLRDGVELSTMTNHQEEKQEVMIDMKTNQ